MPNHYGAKRFSDDDLQQISDMVASPRYATLSAPSEASVTRQPPVAPPLVVQAAFENVAQDLGPAGDERLDAPEWCRTICRQSEYFVNTAIGIDDAYSDIVYQVMYSTDSPHTVTFMELRRVPVFVAIEDDLGDLFRDGAEPILYAPEHRREYERTRPLKIYAEYALPVDFERNEIFVHTDMHFAGSTIATNHVAIEFSDFCRGLPLVPITRPPVARRPRGASTAAVASILDEFPWLELEDLVPQRARAAVARRHDARGPRLPVGDEGDADDDGGLDGDDTDDELPGLVDLAPLPLEDEPPAVIDVVGDLADARISIANADERYYRATVLGGVWTANHVGEAADAAMGMARNGIAT